MMNEVYKTSDQGLAAYLLLLGHNCIGAIPVEGDDRRFDFVFIDVPSPHELAQEFLENKAIGKLHAYRKKLQFLNHILRAEKLTKEDIEELRK